MTHCGTEYDLAILGGSVSGRLAACNAAQKGARVALVAPNWYCIDAAQYLLQALYSADRKPSWSTVCDRVQYQCEQSVFSPTILRSQGIDVILESATFTQDLGLKLGNRQLKASRYVLTDGYGISALSIASDSLLCHQLVHLETIPKYIAVVGQGAAAVEWAYALSRVTTVKLVLLGQRLLSAEDQDIQRLSEAQLRSLGIDIVCLKECAGWEEAKIHADQDVSRWVVVPEASSWKTLSLEKAGIAPGGPITVNPYLQTDCPNIYATGGGLGGENRTELTQQETTLAVHNALFGRWHKMYYERAFYSIELLSPIGRWGLTERQARSCYGRDVKIFQSSCLPENANHVAQINFCKLITLGQRLLGLHLMGEGASTVVTTLGSRPSIHTLNWATTGYQPGMLYDAIYQAVEQWRRCHWTVGQWRRDWAENWFNWRRSW